MKKRELKNLRDGMSPEDRIGAWLSAALEDPMVCDEMKQDIKDWFDQTNDRIADFECPRCGHCCEAKVNKDMKPKFMQLLEKCILDGVVFGHDRAYKHNPTPERYQINEAIVNEVMNEIHEWFDFDEGKE